MKNIRITRILTALAVIAMAFVGQACSDGELLLSSATNPSISPFVSITADPAEVQSGGSTTLKWSVANAATVEISSDDGSFHAGPIDMSGKTEDQIQVDDIMATTTYTITASAAVIDANINPIPHDPYIPVKSGQIEFGGVEDDGADADLAADVASVTDSVTVTVVDSNLSISFRGEGEDNMACMPRVLHWEVTPSDATITIESSTGEVVELSQTCVPEVAPAPAPETETETESDEIEKSRVPAPDGLWGDIPTKKSKAISISKSITTDVPATGCAVVYPCVTTTYTLTATDDSGSMSEDVTIIPDNLLFDRDNTWIKANGELFSTEVASFPAEDVPISYQISPAMIPVTVEADKSVGCELPQNRLLAQMPEVTDCDISEETTFKLMAHLGEDMVEVSRVTVKAGSGSGKVRVDAQDWAFEGEQVTVTVTPKTAGDVAKIAKIRIIGMNVIERVVTDSTPIVETVTVPLAGVSVEVYNSVTDEDPTRQTEVYALPLFSASILGKPITEAMFDEHNPGRSYYGVMTDLQAEGASSFMGSAVTIHRNDSLYSDSSDESGPIDIDVGRLITTWNDSIYANVLSDDFFIEGVKTFPVRAIATKDKDKMFVGTTGAVLYSGNSGQSWKMYGAPFFWKSETGNDYPGQHESCSGEIQTGGMPLVRGSFAYYMGICDILIDGNKMYVATDTGVETDRDVDAILAGQTSGNIKFIPQNGDDTAEFPLHKRVVNDLEMLKDGSTKKIFAAVATGTLSEAMTVNGVYVSEDEGESWRTFGSLGVDVYEVKVDMDNGDAKKIYAATADGVYASDVDSANWQRVYDGAAYSLADDPYSAGTIIAGLESGAAITRNAGSQWNPLTTGGANSSGKVSSIAMEASTNGAFVNYMVAFATEDRFLSGKVMVPVQSGSPSNDGNDDNGDDDMQFTYTIRQEMVHINQQ